MTISNCWASNPKITQFDFCPNIILNWKCHNLISDFVTLYITTLLQKWLLHLSLVFCFIDSKYLMTLYYHLVAYILENMLLAKILESFSYCVLSPLVFHQSPFFRRLHFCNNVSAISHFLLYIKYGQIEVDFLHDLGFHVIPRIIYI